MANNKLVTIDNLKDVIPVLKDDILAKTVLFDEEQDLTEEEKLQARTNIEAVAIEDAVGKKSSNGEIFNDYSENIASGYYSHAEGSFSKASGYASHSEGNFSKASGYASHSEGVSSEASGRVSHSEGYNTKAAGDYSHSKGYGTRALGECSYAEGCHTEAHGNCQHVQGRNNIIDTENKYLFIIGNGDGQPGVIGRRSNAHTLDWDGNAWFAGDVKATDANGNTISLLEIYNMLNSLINNN